MPKIQNAILCACGEHYVASFLSGAGLVVASTRGGVPATDLIVTSERGGRSVSLQVKAGGPHSRTIVKTKPENNQWTWRIGKHAIDRVDKSHWYAFVYVGSWPQTGDAPNVFFVPSKFVARRIGENPSSQREWFWLADDEAAELCDMEGYRALTRALTD
jgi:hypothetical protein